MRSYLTVKRVWRWLAALVLSAACGVGVLGVSAPAPGDTAQAAAPVRDVPQQATGKGIPGKLEGRDAQVRPAPPRYTTAPSPFEPFEPFEPLVDPIFGPNVRANTDATTYAQQEPSIAVN